MALKLKSLLRGQLLALFLKTLIFAGFLILVKIGNFGIIPILFFLAASFWLYLNPVLNSSAYLISYAVFLSAALLLVWRLSSEIPFLIFLALVSVLFYLLLGIKNLFFIFRERWYYIFTLALIYFLAALYFLADKSSYFFWKTGGIFLILFLLWREFLNNLFVNAQLGNAGDRKIPARGTTALAASVIALLIIETFWTVSLLPLNFINAANLALLAAFAITDTIRRYFNGRLSRNFILLVISIVSLVTLVIFAASSWSI